MGFDNECILNIQSLAGEYFCPVCRLLVYPNEALQSQCTHLYCKPCLAYVVSTTRACPYDGYLVTEADSKPLIESNKALAETIGKIAVHCLYHRSGCQWQGPLSDCISHCSGCAFGNSPVVCNRCGVQIVHRQVQEHAQNCPGVQSQTQQAEGVQDAAAQGAAAAADQSQTAAQAGALASQTQPAQITPASAPVQDLNQQVNSNAQVQAVAQAAAPTPEQWYQQQQQQYQQYYQQYPGYDPYQQHYQQYYPYQQQAVQYQHPHMQPHPAHLSGQPQPQPQPQLQPQPQTQTQLQPQPQTQSQLQHQSQSQPQAQPQQQPQLQPQQQPQPQSQLQSQPLAQAQLQPQAQAQLQPQAQAQLQPQAQAQPQPQSLLQAQGQVQAQAQPQPHSLVQAPVAAQHQNQVANQQAQNHPVAQQHSQIQSQTHPQHHGHQHPQTLQYPQAQSHPQPHSVQPRPQHLQMPQYQQPHPPMQHPQSQIQRQPNSQLLPQHHPLPQPQPQPQPLSQTQQPTHQPHPQPHPHPHAHSQHHPPQSNQTSNPNPQSQTQPPPAHAVTGHHSYPQPRPQQQMPLGGLQQQPMHMHPQAQFPQQSPQMRPSQAHAQSQLQPALLPLPGQAQNVLPPQQLPVHPHQQAGHPVHQRAAMQPIQQSLPHQFVQQPPLGAGQNQLHQQGSFMQPPTPTMQSQLRPQAPPQSWQQHSHAYPQPQQKVAMLHGMQPHQPQNVVGRPVMPNQGVQPQPFPQSHVGLAGAVQPRPMHLGPNQPSANQTLGQHLEQSAHPQPGLNVKPSTFEKPSDDLSKKGVGVQEGESFSEKTAREDANGVAATSGIESNMVEMNSETDMKSMDEKLKTTGEDEVTISKINNSAMEIPESMRALGTDPVQQASENGEPVIKQMLKEEVIKSTVERSPGGKSIGIVVEDQKGELSVPPKQVEHSLMQDKENQNGPFLKNPPIQQVEILDEMGGKLQKDSGDASGVMQPFSATSGGIEAVPPAPVPDSSALNATSRGSVSVSERKMLNQPGNQERNLLQAPAMPQGPSNDEHRGFPPPSQVQGRGFVPLPHPVPILDAGRHQPPPMQYGPTVQQRPAAPSSIQAMPPPGLAHNAPVPGQPSTQLQPQAPGLLPHPAQQSRGSFLNEIPPGGILGPGSASSFGRGLSHFGPPQRSFELQSVVSQGHYNQGHGLPSHAGPSRISQGEPIGRPPLGSLPAGSFDSHGGMMVRAPPHGPEGQQRPVNPVESEIFPNPRPNYFDGRQPDSHIPGSSERGPFGQPSGIQSNMMRMNGGLGIDSSLAVGLRDERFKSLPEPGQRSSDHGKFADDLKQFPRSSHLDSDLVPRFGNYFSSSRPLDRGSQGFVMDAAQGLLDKAPLGFNYDPGFKSSASTGTSRFFPPPHPGGDGERSRPIGFHEDNVGRSDLARSHPNFLGSVPEFGRHHMDGLNPRSPTREFSGVPPRGFGGLPGVTGRQSDLDDIDGRESRRFGEGSKAFSLPSDESRFPVLPSHLRRGELEGRGEFVMADHMASRPAPHHLRGGDLIGQDILPSHLQRGEHFGSRNMPGQLRFGEPVFDSFLGHPRMGELSGPGNFPLRLSAGESFGGSNKSSHPRIGEPGFRSTYSLHGFRPGDMESFDNSRKRKPLSMAWCRICKIDCETVEGLELHSQTREHQQMAMDIVLSIKQQNAKKQKLTSKDHSTPDDSSKSKKGVLRGAGISIKP